MKPAYKNEIEMIDLAARIDDADVCFYPAESALAHRFLSSLRGGGLSQRERPDFEDQSLSVLLEAMTVDDHPRPGKKDRTRAREGQVLRELRDLGLDLESEVTIFANVSSGLSTDEDHNYRAYVTQFQRTVSDHSRKVDAYRAERPGFDLGFLIFDESTAYFETLGAFGPDRMGRPHFWFADAAFAEMMTMSGADCFVWLTPCKRMVSADVGEFPLPTLTIIDVALLRHEEHDDYQPKRMVSVER